MKLLKLLQCEVRESSSWLFLDKYISLYVGLKIISVTDMIDTDKIFRIFQTTIYSLLHNPML